MLFSFSSQTHTPPAAERESSYDGAEKYEKLDINHQYDQTSTPGCGSSRGVGERGVGVGCEKKGGGEGGREEGKSEETVWVKLHIQQLRVRMSTRALL